MVVLKAEYVQMNHSVKKLAELYAGLKKEIEQLKKSAEHLELSWKGDANAVFMLRMEEDFFKLSILQESVSKAIQLLAAAIGEYQKTEGIIEQKIGGIRI